MTALIVIGGLILLLVLLVNIPVTAHIKFYGGRLEFAVKYLGIGIFPIKKKKRRIKRKKPKGSRSSKPPVQEDEDIFEDIAEIGLDPDSSEASGSAEVEDDPENPFNEADSGADILGESDEISDNDTDNIADNVPEKSCEKDHAESTGHEEAGGNIPDNSDGNEVKKPQEKDPSPKNEEEDSGIESRIKSHINSLKKIRKKSRDGAADKPKNPLNERLSELENNIEKKKNAALLLWELCEGPLKRLLGKIYVDGLVVDFAAADEDAAKAALSYGKLCAAFYNLLGVIMGLTRVGIKSVRIDCLYDTPSEKSRYDGEFKVKLRPASVLNAVFAVLFGYLRGGGKFKPVLEEFFGVVGENKVYIKKIVKNEYERNFKNG